MDRYISFNKEKGKHTIKPQLILFTTATHGSMYLYERIASAIRLSNEYGKHFCQGKGEVNAEVILLPISFSQIMYNLLQFSMLFKLTPRWRYKVIQLMVTFLDSKSKYSEITYLDKFSDKSLFYKVYSGEIISFNYESIKLTVRMLRLNIISGFLLYLKSAMKAFSLWRQCFKDKKFRPDFFLNLKNENIHIGDLVASQTLRTEAFLGGSLHACFKLYLNLINAIFICKLTKNIYLNHIVKHYISVAEPTYLHSIYERVLHSLGCYVVTLDGFYREAIMTPAKNYSNTKIIQKTYNNLIESNPNINRVIMYMNNRLTRPQEELLYMTIGYNKNIINGIFDIHERNVNIDENNLVIIIFLHSFADAQYYYGLDGFNDLFHWTTFTINNCLKNKSIKKVLIKLHPNVDLERYPTDKVALERLINNYQSNQKIVFLKKDCSIVALAKKYKSYCITHHGSIAEEMVYLGQPVIASYYATWGEAYPFLLIWQSVEEYKNILDSISISSWKPPSEIQRKWLFRYIEDYRLGAKKNCKLEKLNKEEMEMLIKKDAKASSNDKYYNCRAFLNELEPDTEIFKRTLSLLIDDGLPTNFWQ